MSKNKIIIGMLSIFLLTPSIGFAEIQVPTPTPAQDAGGEPAWVATSPRQVCAHYNSMWERAIYIRAVTNTENDCVYEVKVSDSGGFEYIHAYYSGNNLCITNNGGAPSCIPVKRTNITTTQPIKLPQQNQPKVPTKLNTQTPAITQLQTLNDTLNYIIKNLNVSVGIIRNEAGRIFDGIKALFSK